jgi:hypothetical protein
MMASFNRMFPDVQAEPKLSPLQTLRRAFLLINTDMSHADATASAATFGR